MLADAVAAEFYKFLRNRSTLLWGFVFVPLATLLFDLALDTYLKLHTRFPPNLNLGQQVVSALALGGSSFLQIFFVTGAAGIFASEYRWETWRLLTPRNSRINLLEAKFIVYAAAAAASLAALGLVAILQTFYAALLS